MQNQIIFNNEKITPSKVICMGKNYVEDIKELNDKIQEPMVLFNKPNSAITNILNFISEDTRFESEICFLIKDENIVGIGLGLDLTKGIIQKKLKKAGLPWERAKGFDGSAVFSDFVPFNGDITKLRYQLSVNDELQQEANYDLMIYKPNEILEEIKSFMTLEDGDIIMSGTPRGTTTYEECDLFRGTVYCKDDVLLEACWEAV
jgi:2-keto-4-pentenoate hydratase/2-oxohepta-3-ene-1,7-dioic acid hydratase in catechol pathway